MALAKATGTLVPSYASTSFLVSSIAASLGFRGGSGAAYGREGGTGGPGGLAKPIPEPNTIGLGGGR